MTGLPVQYLTVADVVALHHEVMTRTGDTPRPLLDEGKLESAVMRPQFSRQYAGADLVRQATVLGIGISQAQALEESNKRTAFMALRLFLWMNDHRYVGDPLDLAKQLVAVAERTGTLEEATDRFTVWLRSNVAAGHRGVSSDQQADVLLVNDIAGVAPSAAAGLVDTQTSSTKRTTTLILWLSVENNSKFVRGKKKARADIENYHLQRHAMQKLRGWEYELTFWYEDDADLDQQAEALLAEISREADLRKCFVEADLHEKGTERSW